MTTTNTALIVERTAAGGDDLWIECRACGRCNYLSKGPIGHKRGCSTSTAQYGSSVAEAPVATTPDQLRRFAGEVRRTGLTKGRDADVLAAVRAGYLSESAAMNTDD
jgi:hypothetical protein